MDKIMNVIKIFGVIWGILSFVVAVAFFVGGEWKEWSDIKKHVQSASTHGNSAKQLALTCEETNQVSDMSTYPSLELKVTKERFELGFRRVSGGCKIPRAVGGGVQHNAAMLESRPVDNGWRCFAGDPPDKPVPTTVQVYVLACKVE
jgi:hypothetical protein